MSNKLELQAALVICGLFICDFEYMRQRISHFSRAYPLIYSHPWSLYMRIRLMRANFLVPIYKGKPVFEVIRLLLKLLKKTR